MANTGIPDPTGKPVIILRGDFAGKEGLCLGRADAEDLWAVTPKTSDQILQLRLDEDFGILINPGQILGRN